MGSHVDDGHGRDRLAAWDAVQGLRSGGGLVGTGRENDRDPCHYAKVEVVGGLPGGQGAGQPPGSECELVGELQRGHTVVLGEQALFVAGDESVRVALLLSGSICLGLAGT
ncbi:hypothetical protein [Streptomyces sp. NPDC002133]|uniref:hypothetical protein n=1 Tax=Streptomyces sp. NPDC002133 TaxID=3154409 RepID=UPI003330539C